MSLLECSVTWRAFGRCRRRTFFSQLSQTEGENGLRDLAGLNKAGGAHVCVVAAPSVRGTAKKVLETFQRKVSGPTISSHTGEVLCFEDTLGALFFLFPSVVLPTSTF